MRLGLELCVYQAKEPKTKLLLRPIRYAIVHVDPPLGPVSGNQKVANLQMSTCVLALRKPQLVASLGGYIGIMEKNMETT